MPMRLRLSVVVPLIALLLHPTLGSPAAADIAPTVPTYALKWGNAGTAPGQFTNGSGVAVDALGNVYVADYHRIQKFDYLGNLITQWGSLGSGDGQFNAPDQIAIDAAGNVYVTDFGNARVQKFTSSGVFLGKWGSLGSGDGQFLGPEGIAIDASGNVYVAEQGNDRIQKFSSTGVFITKWGTSGAGNGQLDYPVGVAVDKSGYVYVAEYANNRVQKFTSTGTFVAKWGTGGAGDGQFDAPGPIAIDKTGNVYVGEYLGHRVQKFTADGTFLAKWGSLGSGDGQFNGPWGLGFDGAGNLYVSEWDGNRVQKFMGSGSFGTRPQPAFVTSWGDCGTFNGIQDVAVHPLGDVFTLERINGRVQKFNSAGALLAEWPGLLNNPYGIATDGSGRVYVADTGNNRIMRFTSFGTISTQWGFPGAGNGEFNQPRSIAIDASGNIYVADYANHRIQKFNINGGYITQWGSLGTGDGQFSSPQGVATDALGNVYVSEQGTNRVQKFTGSGVFLAKWGSPGLGNGQFNDPRSLDVDAAGNVYVSEALSNRVQQFTANGAFLTKWGSLGAGAGQFSSPIGVATSGAFIYVVDSGNCRLQKFWRNGAEIALVSDVGMDQGGMARVRILRSPADDPASTSPIVRYDVFRRIETPAAIASAAPASIQLAGWDQVGSISAYGESEYSVVVPTVVNANASTGWYTAYMVRAATASQFTFFDSGVELGYSVDNLSPAAPSPFMGAYASGATQLDWGVSTASDFSRFQLYRGASVDFTPGPGNLIATTTETDHADVGPAGSWYKLVAVDVNENLSAPAVLGPEQTTDVPSDAPLSFALDGVRPNPASGRDLVVHFTLPSRESARLVLIDLAGRRVAAVDVGERGPGRHAVNLAQGMRVRPGLYFVRLTQGASQKTSRVTVLE